MGSINHLQSSKKTKKLTHSFLPAQKANHSESDKVLFTSHMTFEEHYAHFYENAPLGYYTLDEAALISDVNYVGAKIVGLYKEGMLQKSFTRYIAPDYQFIFSGFKQRILTSMEAQTCELKMFKKNGPLVYARLEGKAIFDKSTNKKKILLTAHDVRMRKYERDALGVSAKFSSDRANEESIAVIAHELHHPHAVIGNYLEGTLTRLENDNCKNEDLAYSLRQSLKQLDRAYELILCLENYVCKGALSFETININALISETLDLFRVEVTDFPLIIDYRPQKQDLFLNVDRIHIQQVILNLARNAMEAMKTDGTNAPRLVVSVNLINQDHMQISILDNGFGVDQNQLSRLFSPHFSSKPAGIGLGLAISRRIVEAHQGSLSYEPNFPRGTCFKVILPIMINRYQCDAGFEYGQASING